MPFKHTKITLGSGDDDHIHLFAADEAFWDDEFKVERHWELRRFCCELFALFDRLIDAANHVEGLLGKVIIFTVNNRLE